MANNGYLKEGWVWGGRLAISLEGGYYFSSPRISCRPCQPPLNKGETMSRHSAITAVAVDNGRDFIFV